MDLSNARCPRCKHGINQATKIRRGILSPRPGDFSLCWYCGEILRFDGFVKNGVRSASPNELIILRDERPKTYIDIRRVQAQIVERMYAHEDSTGDKK